MRSHAVSSAFLYACFGFALAAQPTWGQTVIDVDCGAPGADDATSWCDAFVDVQDASVAAARSVGTIDEIRIAQGTYKPEQGVGQVAEGIASTPAVVTMALYGSYAACAPCDPDGRDVFHFVPTIDGNFDGGRLFTSRTVNPKSGG